MTKEEILEEINTVLQQDAILPAEFNHVRELLLTLEYLEMTRVREPTRFLEPTMPAHIYCTRPGCTNSSRTTSIYVLEFANLCSEHIYDSAIGNPKLSAVGFRIGRDGVTGAKMNSD